MATGDIKQQADSVPLPLAKGMAYALSDLLGKLYYVLKQQEQISREKFGDPKASPAVEGIVTLKVSQQANWSPKPKVAGEDPRVSLKPWGAPLEALFRDDFGAVKTMALFNAIKLADGGYGQFAEIVAGTWQGMPPNIKGFIPRLLKISAALRLLEMHYATLADWDEGGASAFESDAYTSANESVKVLKQRLAQLMFLLVQREGQVPIKGSEKGYLVKVCSELSVDLTEEMTYADLANSLDKLASKGSLSDLEYKLVRLVLDAGAKDFAAYFTLRRINKRDLSAFEKSCYGQAVDKQMAAMMKNTGKTGKSKDDLVLAELQALQDLPF
jgi:hypothetical protein